MLWFLRRVAPGLLSFVFGTFVLWTGQIGPNDAWENWKKWLKWLGIETVPPWVRTAEFYTLAMIVGGLFVVAGICFGLWAWWHSYDQGRPREPIVPHLQYISLKEAVTRTYEAFRKTDGTAKNAADELGDGDPLGWCASFLIAVKHIPVYGAHPPSRDRERIPDIDLRHLVVEKQATELHEVLSGNNPRWTNLEVLLDDFIPVLQAIPRDYRE